MTWARSPAQATLVPTVVGSASLPTGLAVGGDAAGPGLGTRATVLGLALKDEVASARLSAAGWAAFPVELHRSLADDLFARLRDNMDGHDDPVEAAMGFLHALTRDVSTPYKAADFSFWRAAPKFVREMRKMDLPDWLPFLLESLATAVRERAGQTAGQITAETRRIVAAAVPPGLRARRPEFALVEEAIREAYPVGATTQQRARMVAATRSLRVLLAVANHVNLRTAAARVARLGVAFCDVAAEFEIQRALSPGVWA